MTAPYIPGPGPAAAPQQAPEPPRRSRTRLVVGLVAAFLILAAGLAVGTGWYLSRDAAPTSAWAQEQQQSSTLAGAQKGCDPTKAATRLGDEGKTLVVDGAAADSVTKGLNLDGVECILRMLKTPTAVTELMNSTRALDGRQTAEWGDYSASWTYHPDDGLDMIITQK